MSAEFLPNDSTVTALEFISRILGLPTNLRSPCLYPAIATKYSFQGLSNNIYVVLSV
ncbi:MAG: hypothetical protein V7L20_01190 [Nostoc sp.]